MTIPMLTRITVKAAQKAFAVIYNSESSDKVFTANMTGFMSQVAANRSGFAINTAPPVKATMIHKNNAAVQNGISRTFKNAEITEYPPNIISDTGAMQRLTTVEYTNILTTFGDLSRPYLRMI